VSTVPRGFRQALFHAPFNAPQHKIVQCIADLTLGRNRAGVRLSRADLAALCGTTPSSHFRDALDELLAKGVVRRLAPRRGRTPAAYGITTDFANGWGSFSVSAAKLADLFAHVESTNEEGSYEPPGRLMRQPPRGLTNGRVCQPAGGPTNRYEPPGGPITRARENRNARVGGFDLSSSPERDHPTQDKPHDVDDVGAYARARADVAQRLESDDDVGVFEAVLAKVPDPQAVASECRAALDGMHGVQKTPAELAIGLRDFLGNGELGDRNRFRMPVFREYLRRAVVPSAPLRATPVTPTATTSAAGDTPRSPYADFFEGR
jgi:hypothetical protein